MSWKKSLLSTCKISGCLLAHWLPMTSILYLIERIWRYQLRCNYLIKKNAAQFFASFLKSRWNFECLEKKVTLIALVFPKLRTPKTWLHKCPKSPVWEYSSTSNMVNVPKHCRNYHHSTFIIFIDHFQVNGVRKSLSYWDGKSWYCLLTHWLPSKSILFFIETI